MNEVLAGVSSASTTAPTEAEEHALRRVDAPVVALLVLHDGEVLHVAADGRSPPLLLGPYAGVTTAT